MSKECGLHKLNQITGHCTINSGRVCCHSNRIYYSKLKLTGCTRKCFKMNKYINVTIPASENNKCKNKGRQTARQVLDW